MSTTLRNFVAEAKTWPRPWTIAQLRQIRSRINLGWTDVKDMPHTEYIPQLERQVEEWIVEEATKRMTK